jgi:hypothetical protein
VGRIGLAAGAGYDQRAPRVPEDRYYVLQFIDLFTYNCAYIGRERPVMAPTTN